MMDFAVAIPVFNQPELLKKCLDSIIGQTSSLNFPIYIFDDASVVDYQNVINQFDGTRIKYAKHEKNLGALANMQFALAQTAINHQFVMVMHEDDLLAPWFVEKIENEFTRVVQEPALLLSYFYEFIGEGELTQLTDNGEVIRLSKEELTWEFLKNKPIAFGSAIYNTAYFKEMNLRYNLFEEFADRPFLLEYLPNEALVLVNSSRDYYYRSHANNDIRWKKLGVKNILELLRFYRSIVVDGKHIEGKFKREATQVFVDSAENLKLSGQFPGWFLYVCYGLFQNLVSFKYLLLRISWFNNLVTFLSGRHRFSN